MMGPMDFYFYDIPRPSWQRAEGVLIISVDKLCILEFKSSLIKANFIDK